MPLFHLVYASSATKPFSEADLINLLAVSRRNNNAADISGMLLYRGGNFMQVLEGEEKSVREVHARINRDPRHFGVLTLLQGPIAARTFSNWTMAFRNLDSDEVKNTLGYSEFLNDDWLSPALRDNPTRTMQLLELFRKSMR